MKKEHFEKLGKELELTDKQIEGVFKRLIINKAKAIQWIDNSFLSDGMKTSYKNLLESRYNQL